MSIALARSADPEPSGAPVSDDRGGVSTSRSNVVIVALSLVAAGCAAVAGADPALAAGIFALGVALAIARGGIHASVLVAAVLIQWLQIECALIYQAVTGRRIHEMVACDYQATVIASLGALVALVVGLRIGEVIVRRPREGRPTSVQSDEPALGQRLLWQTYFALFLVEPVIQSIASSVPSLREVIVVLGLFRLVVLFVLVRRLLEARRAAAIVAIVLVEVAVGTSGYFANFKDPLGVIGIALLDGLRVRRFGHWLALGALTVLTFVVFVLWTGVKHDLRREARYSGVAFGFEDRVNRFQNAAEKWIDRGPELWVRSTDQLMSRLWPVYYPALAMRRVPASRPHESGALMRGAIEFTLKPRLLFPDKPTLDDADSNMVRQYAGVFVAGDREQTSIAFGHIGESYVDFGVPGVVVYELLFGVFLGLVMATLGAYIRNPELAAGITVVTGLLAPSAASWTKILGGTVHMAVALGAVGVMLSALLARRRAQQAAANSDARALSTDA